MCMFLSIFYVNFAHLVKCIFLCCRLNLCILVDLPVYVLIQEEGDCPFCTLKTYILKDFENASPRLNPLFHKPG